MGGFFGIFCFFVTSLLGPEDGPWFHSTSFFLTEFGIIRTKANDYAHKGSI